MTIRGPFLFSGGNGGGVAAGSAEFITGVVVTTYNDLPSADANAGKLAVVQQNQGVWFVNYKSKGLWYSDGSTWAYEGDYAATDEASEILYDPTGNSFIVSASNVQDALDAVDVLLNDFATSAELSAAVGSVSALLTSRANAVSNTASVNLATLSADMISVTNRVSNTASVNLAAVSGLITTANLYSFVTVSTGREISAGDHGKYLRTEGTTALTLTLPTCASAGIPIGSSFIVRQAGTGKITVAAAGGVSVAVPVSATAQSRGQHSSIFLAKVGSDTWDIGGDLSVV